MAMQRGTNPFTFDYFDSDVVYGRGRTAELGVYLEDQVWERALVVCGSNVGANQDVMDPIRNGLGEKFAGIFDETTPKKRIETMTNGIERISETNPDVLIGVGGGSSLDVARQMDVFEAADTDLASLRSKAQDGHLSLLEPTRPIRPVIVVPTTFAGADISSGGSIEVLSPDESPTNQSIRTKGSNMPVGMFYDPDLFETTPWSAMVGSIMNGFDKGIEALYSGDPMPIRDATASHGLRLLRNALPQLPGDPGAMELAVSGIILVQFQRRLSIIHAVGHGFSRRYPVQQGNVHAVMAPHVLKYLFDAIDCRRELIARGFDVDPASRSPDELATVIVDRVVEFRDSHGLPTRLRELDPVERNDFPAIAEFIMNDPLIKEVPDGLNPTADEIELILEEAW